MIAQGQTALAADGTFRIRFTPEADERLGKDASALTYRYEAVAEATDEGGETRSDTRSFRLGFVSVEASVALATEFFRESVPGELTITRTDLDGVPRPGKGVWRLTEIVQPPKTLLPAEMPAPAAREGESEHDPYATPGDRLRPRWDSSFDLGAALRGWPDGRERAHGEVVHDARGQAGVKLPPLAAGAWRLHYVTTDAFGARYETTRDFLVAGKGGIPVRLPGVLLAERSSVPVGETARFLLGSATSRPDRFRRDASRRTRGVAIAEASVEGVLEFPVTEDSRGGFAIRLSLVRDHQFVALASSVFVPWSDEELQVEFATFRDKIRPGAKETWRVTVKAPEGSGAGSRTRTRAELLAYMYDRSLDAFLPHTPPSALGLYPNRHLGGRAPGEPVPGARAVDLRRRPRDPHGGRGPLRRRGPLLRELRHRRPRGPHADDGEVRGAGRRCGGYPSPRRRRPTRARRARWARSWTPSAGKARRRRTRRRSGRTPQARGAAPLRSNFAETAFWRPQLLTGADGSAVIEFEVPDSVTSWNVWVHAVTRDLKAGARPAGDAERQGPDGAAVRAALPARGRRGAS